MTVVVLVLLLLAAAAPLLLTPLRRALADPVLPVAALAALLLALAAALAAQADPVDGWRLAAALVIGVLAATTSGSLVVRAVFRLMRREFLPARTRPLPAPTASAASTAPMPRAETTAVEERPDDADRPESVLRGGAWIGYLERAAVASTLLAGWPEGVALVLAVKGVGRYAELRETNAPETFIIGTLASLLWAVAAAGTAHLLR
jgi:hypothetical protein